MPATTANATGSGLTSMTAGASGPGGAGMQGRSGQPPWKVLTCDAAQGGHIVDLTRERFEGAPGYTGGTVPNRSDQAYGQRVNDRCGVPFGM